MTTYSVTLLATAVIKSITNQLQLAGQVRQNNDDDKRIIIITFKWMQ